MDETRKHILDRFQEHLQDNFETYCERHRIDKTDTHLITFLIDQNLIPAVQIQRYSVQKEFEQLLLEVDCTKIQAVGTLAHRFNISERTVWTILKNIRSGRKAKSPQ